MYYVLIVYFFLSLILFYSCAKISYKFGLVDIPDSRKIHSNATAYTGGISISISCVLSILLFQISTNNLNLILSIAFLICIIGFIDDRFDLTVGSKLSLQIIPIFYLIILENFALNHLGDYYYFKLNLGSFVVPFTLLAVLFLINAFNYFDGIDGTLSFASISVLGILFFLFPDQEFRFFILIILIPLSVFLCFNFSIFKLPKMFLGDGGSLFLGFVISFLLIYLGNNDLVHPILLAWSIAIFVYEFLSINLIRLKNNKNPFKAGHDHLHHVLLKNTNSIFLTNLYIVMINIILFLIGYFTFILISNLVSLILFISIFVIFIILRNNFAENLKNI
tara:strand:- start:2786 stop:3790 length:1005 start_codon:yes stop_codon:yes gene_type:complete